MTEGTGEQDLVKALDNVAGAAASVGGVPNPYGQAVPVQHAGAVPSPYPAIQPMPAPLPTQPSDTPPYLSPDPSAPLIYPTAPVPAPAVVTEDSGPLAAIKQDALVELRPLVDKLNVSPEEKFDTYLLLIRSTDDTNLIGPAHDAAKAITDETRRAEALLDIIKEIDYLSHPKTDA
ncbi:MAG: hypothetical protein JWO07_32 [Candidatus Saccharibacteria bacterium]|nr:hypothetical protein [Candidatus Saccharibacteria bacterium]